MISVWDRNNKNHHIFKSLDCILAGKSKRLDVDHFPTHSYQFTHRYIFPY
jgi:uncharacterized protein (DUF2249 family)